MKSNRVVRAGRESNASNSCINIGDKNGGGAVIIFNRIVAAIIVAVTICESCSILIKKGRKKLSSRVSLS